MESNSKILITFENKVCNAYYKSTCVTKLLSSAGKCAYYNKYNNICHKPRERQCSSCWERRKGKKTLAGGRIRLYGAFHRGKWISTINHNKTYLARKTCFSINQPGSCNFQKFVFHSVFGFTTLPRVPPRILHFSTLINLLLID